MSNAKKWYDSERTSKSRAEDFASEILKNNRIEALQSIPSVTRINSYDAGHGESHKSVHNPKTEKEIAKALYKQTHSYIGRIYDYEVPLNNKQKQGDGDIDLIAFNRSEQTLTLLELKRADSPETLLRATLEIFSYWKTVDHKKLLSDFDFPDSATVEKAVLLFDGSYAYEEYVNKTSAYTIALIRELDVGFYGIRKISGGYEVFIP